jgi:hypothetical protein
MFAGCPTLSDLQHRGSMLTMDALKCELVRWVSDDPQPGLVEVRLLDANGSEWMFVDKVPIFTVAPVSSATQLPISGEIRCDVVGSRQAPGGQELVDVELRDGVETADGVSRLTIRRDQLVRAVHGP